MKGFLLIGLLLLIISAEALEHSKHEQNRLARLKSKQQHQLQQQREQQSLQLQTNLQSSLLQQDDKQQGSEFGKGKSKESIKNFY